MMLKNNYNGGYSLVGIMIALTVATVLLMSLTKSYMSSRQATAYTNAANVMTSQLDLTLNQLSSDIGKSGSFGCYNLRQQVVVAPSTAAMHDIGASGTVNPATGGLMVFSSSGALAEAGTPLNGINLASDAQVLKVQYGEGFALVESPITSPITVITFHQPDYKTLSGGNFVSLGGSNAAGKLEVSGFNTSSLAALASCSRWDLIQGTLVGNTLNISSLYNISLSTPPLHDIASLALMNVRTRYYYVATINGISGLYVNQLLTNGTFSGSLLLLPNVSKLEFTFRVAAASGRKDNIVLSAMGAGDWLNLTGVNIFFNYRSAESVTDNNQPLVISESASVAILSSGLNS